MSAALQLTTGSARPCIACWQVPTPHPVFDYVMADALVTIVVELMATPPQVGPAYYCLSTWKYKAAHTGT